MLDAHSTALLRRFAHAMRQPDESVTAAHDERLGVYQRLFFNSILTLLTNAFPVTQALLGPTHWPALIRAFYAAGCAQTPRFTELSPELIAFLHADPQRAAGLGKSWPAPTQAVLELLHYEWVETELMLSDALATPEATLENQPLQNQPLQAAALAVLSPLTRPLAYLYAVHEISASHPPPSAPPLMPSYLLAWRNAAFEVKFQTLTQAALQLLLRFQTPQQLDLSKELPDAERLITRWLESGVLRSSA